MSRLDTDDLFFGDNGAIFCGGCAGATASYTGRDLSGLPVQRITPEAAAAFEAELADIGAKCACESCGKVAPKVYTNADLILSGLEYVGDYDEE